MTTKYARWLVASGFTFATLQGAKSFIHPLSSFKDSCIFLPAFYLFFLLGQPANTLLLNLLNP